VKKEWTGWWVAALGLVHTVFGLTVYSPGWSAILRGGIWNSVDGDVVREHAFWFTAFGPAFALLGCLMTWVERRGGAPLPRFLGYAFLVAVAVFGIFMPFSGMWLLVPPGVALVRRS